MPAARTISQDRAARIARGHACPNCQEYSFKKLAVRKASPSQAAALKTAWVVSRTCGVCALEEELGIDGAGEITYSG